MNESILTAHYNEVVIELSKELSLFTPQLFSVKDHTKSVIPPRADASSLLIEAGDRHFLVTAAHVFHECEMDKIGFMINREFITIGGTTRYFEPNELDDCDPNKVDMAVTELHKETTQAFKEAYRFLPLEKVGFHHQTGTGEPYLVYGYPKSRTKKDFPTKRILPKPFIFRTTGYNEDYYFTNSIDSNKTIVLHTPPSGIRSKDGGEADLPELGGISGGGVWHLNDLHALKPKYELVSLITGEDEGRTVLYSTRVYTLKRILVEVFGVVLI